MGFFNRKKQTVDPKNDQTSPVVSTQVTQVNLSNSAEVRKEIDMRFRQLKEKTANNSFAYTAGKNQEILEHYKQLEEYGVENLSSLVKYDREMLIVPGGYYAVAGESEDRSRNDLDYFAKAIRVLEAKFRETSAASAVSTGADRLEPVISGMLDALYNAMESGNAMKAHAAINAIKYVLVVGYRFEDHGSDEEREQSIRNKQEILDKVGNGLIRMTDELFKQVGQYRLEEERYAEDLKQSIILRENYEQNCPDETKQLIERLGYKGMEEALAPGDPRRTYLNMVIEMQRASVPVLMRSMMMEAISRFVIDLMSGIREMSFEMKKAFADNGKQFDFNANLRILDSINAKNVHTIDDINKNTLKFSNSLETLEGEMARLASDRKVAESAEMAVKSIREWDYLQQLNEDFKLQQEQQKTKYEVSKRKAELEKQAHMEEVRLQNELELREIEEIEERLREEMENREEEPEYEANITEPIDNREVIIEEA